MLWRDRGQISVSMLITVVLGRPGFEIVHDKQNITY